MVQDHYADGAPHWCRISDQLYKIGLSESERATHALAGKGKSKGKGKSASMTYRRLQADTAERLREARNGDKLGLSRPMGDLPPLEGR